MLDTADTLTSAQRATLEAAQAAMCWDDALAFQDGKAWRLRYLVGAEWYVTEPERPGAFWARLEGMAAVELARQADERKAVKATLEAAPIETLAHEIRRRASVEGDDMLETIGQLAGEYLTLDHLDEHCNHQLKDLRDIWEAIQPPPVLEGVDAERLVASTCRAVFDHDMDAWADVRHVLEASGVYGAAGAQVAELI